MTTVFEGTLKNCLAHLKTTLGMRNLAEREVIAGFTGVQQSAVYRWLGGTPPYGGPLVKLMFYLEHLGYKVVELNKLQAPVRETARLFAFGIISFDDIGEVVQYSKHSLSDQLLDLFRGKRFASEERLREFSEIVEAHGRKLPDRVAKTPRISLAAGKQERATPVASTPAVPSVPASAKASRLQELGTQLTPATRDALMRSLANAVVSLLPLAEIISSDSFTEEERAQVRELAGGEGVFLLANRLYRICGERTRKAHSEH